MNETDKAIEQVGNIAAGMFIAFIFFIGALSGYGVSQLVKTKKAEEAGFREKIQFCHDRLKSEKVRYVWRQEYCKGLDAVDPISGRPVSGVIEGE